MAYISLSGSPCAEIHCQHGFCAQVWEAVWFPGEREEAASTSELPELSQQMEPASVLPATVRMTTVPFHCFICSWAGVLGQCSLDILWPSCFLQCDI